jgi:NADPH:quinone reductase-like Zn-dependent oxidoreductase
MATATSTQNHARTAANSAITTHTPPPVAKTLIFDLSSKTLHLHPCHPTPVPDPTKNDHLIHVKTTALCSGELRWPFLFADAIFSENPEKQITPGYDLAGTVITSPPGSPFQPGDEIYCRTLPNRPGNSREYTIARTGEMALKPSGLDWAKAASVPLSAITAWQALFEHAGVEAPGLDDLNEAGVKGREKKRVLVTAAAGGVGLWLVQLGTIAGLEVVAQIGSVENERFVRKLGAKETVNYKEVSLKQWAETKGSAVDIVIDCIGGKALEDAWYCVKDGGSLISIVGHPEEKKPEDMGKQDVKNLFFIMTPNGTQLAKISKLLDEGKCSVEVDSIWKLEEFEKAFERLDSGHARGKVVVNVAA